MITCVKATRTPPEIKPNYNTKEVFFLGQWNHIDCSQPSPDNPKEYLQYEVKRYLIFSGDLNEEDFVAYGSFESLLESCPGLFQIFPALTEHFPDVAERINSETEERHWTRIS